LYIFSAEIVEAKEVTRQAHEKRGKPVDSGVILYEYTKHRDHAERIRSAYLAIKAILDLDLYKQHKRDLLDICIWKITEVDGKDKTRYRSLEALNEKNSRNLQHEHVFEKSFLIDMLLDNKDDYEHILEKAVACMVTKEEHERLTRISREYKGKIDLQGWARYKMAKIRVYDLLEKKEFDL